jgi:heptosyltransferase-2
MHPDPGGTAPGGRGMRILVVAPNWIGDAVMAQPLLALLRTQHPRAHLDVLAPPVVAPVFRAMPEVTEVIESANRHGRPQWGERWRLSRHLRARGYGRCYVLPNSAKSALAPWLAGIPLRIGHHGESRYLLLNRRKPAREGEERRPMVEFYAELADHAGPVTDPVLSPRPGLADATRARLGLRPDEPLIVLCPGAEYGPAKRWPSRHFAALASLSAAEWPEASIALLGSARERPMATEIAALSGQDLRNLCGDTSLDEAIALIASASAVVSNDSGLMHVAAACRRPQVAVFGSSDPRHTPPRSPQAQVQWLQLACSPCFQRECPLGHTRCLNDLSPTAVFASLRQALQPHAERPSR